MSWWERALFWSEGPSSIPGVRGDFFAIGAFEASHESRRVTPEIQCLSNWLCLRLQPLQDLRCENPAIFLDDFCSEALFWAKCSASDCIMIVARNNSIFSYQSGNQRKNSPRNKSKQMGVTNTQTAIGNKLEIKKTLNHARIQVQAPIVHRLLVHTDGAQKNP